MFTAELAHKELFNYLKNALPNDEVSINHPLATTTLTKGVLTVLPLNNSLAGKYITEANKGIVFQVTVYHQNFAEINTLNSKVRKLILDFKPNNLGNTKIIRELSPKFINTIALWQGIINLCWYFEEIN